MLDPLRARSRPYVVVRFSVGRALGQHRLENDDLTTGLEGSCELADETGKVTVIDLMLQNGNTDDHVEGAVFDFRINYICTFQNNVRKTPQARPRRVDHARADVVSHNLGATNGERFSYIACPTSEVKYPKARATLDTQLAQCR
jgi:hypothetical protein